MEKGKKQFKGASRKPDFYDRKVIHSTAARLLAITKIIPEDWIYVRMWKMKQTKKAVTVIIEKLVGEDRVAPAQAVSKDNK